MAHGETTRKYFISDALDEINNGSVTDMETRLLLEESRINYFGRASYNYLEKYLVEFVFRYDGSYRFPSDKRYGFFPGVSAAWRASEEPFWQDNLDFINYFKLRGSVSQTGNDYLVDTDGNLDRSIQYLNTYGLAPSIFLVHLFKKLSATHTKPEYHLGGWNNIRPWLQFKFLDNRLSVESDLFYQKRTNILSIEMPPYLKSRASHYLENIGEMSNKGIEGLVSWADRAGRVNYDVTFNMTYARINYYSGTKLLVSPVSSSNRISCKYRVVVYRRRCI